MGLEFRFVALLIMLIIPAATGPYLTIVQQMIASECVLGGLRDLSFVGGQTKGPAISWFHERSYSYAKILISATSLRDLNEVTPAGGRRSRKQ